MENAALNGANYVIAALLGATALVFAGGIWDDYVVAFVRHRLPAFGYRGETLLLLGLLGIAAAAIGAVILYVLFAPWSGR
jgi:hypothetical protein